MAFEEEFGIAISDEAAGRFPTPRHVIDHLTTKIQAGASTKFNRHTPREEVRTLLRQIVREQLGIDDFSDDDEFIRDLGAD
jgi:acyl carrier protein